MPMPKPRKDEDKDVFLSRCMADETMRKDYKETDQRYAVCQSQWSRKDKEEDDADQ